MEASTDKIPPEWQFLVLLTEKELIEFLYGINITIKFYQLLCKMWYVYMGFTLGENPSVPQRILKNELDMNKVNVLYHNNYYTI